ncbi:hypothetical protein L596_022283 [Steinernema carpocapsae]|uniref:Uncharacterized protein n=1 Tax=Steinernema carpocapsae TaxID=34508 RepID=A0A4U5MLC3_STECR|nr:hypothetical protein L596_022283 [Steinernema carpocapsae]
MINDILQLHSIIYVELTRLHCKTSLPVAFLHGGKSIRELHGVASGSNIVKPYTKAVEILVMRLSSVFHHRGKHHVK